MVEDLERARQYQAIGKDRPFVHSAVPVHVLENGDIADGILGIAPGRVRKKRLQLEDPHPAVGIEVDDDRRLDQRLGSHELRVVARRQ